MIIINLESQDNKNNSIYQPENFYLIEPYVGQKNDRVLKDLIPFLKDLANEEDVRDVEQKYREYLAKTESEKTSKLNDLSLVAKEQITEVSSSAETQNTDMTSTAIAQEV